MNRLDVPRDPEPLKMLLVESSIQPNDLKNMFKLLGPYWANDELKASRTSNGYIVLHLNREKFMDKLKPNPKTLQKRIQTEDIVTIDTNTQTVIKINNNSASYLNNV